MKASDFFGNGFYREESYSGFVRKQVEGMDVDDLIIADLGEKAEFHAFRMNLTKIAEKLGMKFKTKIKDGKLYVGRVY